MFVLCYETLSNKGLKPAKFDGIYKQYIKTNINKSTQHFYWRHLELRARYKSV